MAFPSYLQPTTMRLSLLPVTNKPGKNRHPGPLGCTTHGFLAVLVFKWQLLKLESKCKGMGNLRVIHSDLQILPPRLCREMQPSLPCHPSPTLAASCSAAVQAVSSTWTLFSWLSSAIPALIKHQAEQIPKSTLSAVPNS